MSRAAAARVWLAPLLTVLSLLLFVVLATQSLGWLGPYYDEWIFVPVSLRFLGECELDAAVGIAKGCVPLMQSPPYVGVIKAALIAPVFAVFGVDAWSVRLPPILLTAFVLWRFQRFLSPRIGAWAVLGLLLMAVDPVLIEHARFDWGPFVVSNLCKLLGLAALWRWLESGRSLDLALALVLCIVGLLDKLSFVWVAFAYVFAVVLTQPDWLLTRLRALPRVQTRMLAGAAVFMLLIAWKLILPALRIELPGFEQPLGPIERLLRVLDLYDLSFAGLALRRWVFGVDLVVPLWPRLLLGLQCAAALGLLWWRRREYAKDRGPLRLLAMFTAIIFGLLLMLVATREVGGSHHLVVLWPFPLLQALAMIACVPGTIRAGAARRVGVAAALALILLPAARGLLTYRDALPLWAGERAVRGHFDPVLYDVAAALAEIDADSVISSEWGLHHGLLSLARPADRLKYRDWTWRLLQGPETDPAATAVLHQRFIANRRVVWLSYRRSKGEPATHRGADYLHAWRACLESSQVHVGRRSDVEIELQVLSFGSMPCRSQAPTAKPGAVTPTAR
jgi:hypothetical protein